MDKLGASVKSSSASVAAMFSPKKAPAPAPIATSNGKAGNGKAGPNVFVAMAELSERSDNLDDAEAQYKKALDLDPNHLGALLGYAHLQDRRHNFEAAIKLYQQAQKKHPKEASVHNDLGLCYHRRGMLPEAAKELQRTVELNPDRKLYRNNLAAVYVDQGKSKEALAQLTIAHGEAVGNYNLAYLLVKKQDNPSALAHFRKAAEIDPTLVAAQQWIEKLSTPAGQPEPQATRWAGADQRQREPVLTARRDSSATFAVSPIASVPSAASQVVLRAGGTGDEPQYPAATVRTQPEKPEVQVQAPQARRPNTLRESTPPASEKASGQAPAGDNRLPTVTPSNG